MVDRSIFDARSGPHSLETGKPSRSAAETAANAAKYRADMKPYVDAELMKNRSELVRKYRGHPGSWPDGIDSKYDRWYRASDWTDAGEFKGDRAWFDELHPEGAAINTPAEKAAKLAVARAALAGVEAKVGVKPAVTNIPESKTPTVTRGPSSRDADISEHVTVTRAEESGVTPVTEEKLTPAERAKRYRDRKKGKGEG